MWDGAPPLQKITGQNNKKHCAAQVHNPVAFLAYLARGLHKAPQNNREQAKPDRIKEVARK